MNNHIFCNSTSFFKMKVTNPFVTSEDIAVVARKIFASTNGYTNKTTKWTDKLFCQSMIGTSYVVCSEIWNLIQVRIIDAPEILEEALADELKRNKMTFSKFVIQVKPDHLL